MLATIGGGRTVVADSSASAGGPGGGLFTGDERDLHINAKELLALKFALPAFCNNVQNGYLKCIVDKMGI